MILLRKDVILTPADLLMSTLKGGLEIGMVTGMDVTDLEEEVNGGILMVLIDDLSINLFHILSICVHFSNTMISIHF